MPPSLQLKSAYQPAGHQPQAIKQLTAGLKAGHKNQTLLGVTGSGKTFTIANVIAQTQKPTLVISHNKTLTAQLTEEFQEFFPQSAVHYFVSYFDYYQPEAYLPRSDTYIAKDSAINDEIERLRHAAMEAILTRADVIIVASVSCIYGLGSPAAYLAASLNLKPGDQISRQQLLKHLTQLQYSRNDIDLTRGHYRVRGDIVDIHPASADHIIRLEFFGPQIENITIRDSLTGHNISPSSEGEPASPAGRPEGVRIFPATLFTSDQSHYKSALNNIRQELADRLQYFKQQNKLVEAQRLQERTTYDLEMIEQVGFVSGLENYSRWLDNRPPGQPPSTLIDYFNFRYGQNFLTVIDESHMTIPQIGGMYLGDQARKKTLIDFGFRLPSAFDHRPLKFNEFEDKVSQMIFVSATPAKYEKNTSAQTVEQIVRPTGLLDPTIVIRPTNHQIDDVMDEIQTTIKNQQRALITTLTKRMAEELATYLVETGTKAAYLHSDVDTLDRLDILRDLRRGTYDVLVGINLLREGLDLPEVSLVAIMDADKEGYLRSETSLIQTMGRAARHLQGHVIMYADKITGSMQAAIDETTRRRRIQESYNQKHNITPQSITKAIRAQTFYASATGRADIAKIKPEDIAPEDKDHITRELTDKMHLAAQNLEFEKAAELRDLIQQLKQ